MSVARIALLISFVTLVIQTPERALAIRVPVNQTNNAEDETLVEAEFRDRYRRLIPYMTYYVVNNYVRAQQPQQQQQQQQAKIPRYQKPSSQDNRFVPSVQYDPKELGPDSDVFLPLRYGDKENYRDYATVRTPRPLSIIQQSTIPATRYHTTSRPEYTKLLPAKPQLSDYPNYGNQDPFESIRFVPQSPRPNSARYVTQTPPRVSLNHVLKSLQLTNQLPEVLNKDNIDSSIMTLVEILNILNAGKKESYAPNYGKFRTTNTKPKVITESNYQATQFSSQPHELLEIKTARPYVKPVKIPTAPEDYRINPYADQIKIPMMPLSTDNLISQIKTTRPYFQHPIKSYTTPIPNEDLVEIKPIPSYAKIPADIKPYVPYVKQVTAQASIANDDLVRMNIHHYTKAPLPIRYEEEKEEQSMNMYLDEGKVAQDDATKLKPLGDEEVDDEKQPATYVQPTETRTPQPPTQDVQKIFQYYVPIVEDIDVEKATYKPVNKEPAMSPSIEHTSQNDFVHHDSILEDERLTFPVSTEKPIEIAEPTITPLLKLGATRGKPHIDYPAYTEIPETDFSCKQQRYKGFFGDPQTGCQVWHYCDLNGGKSSFLCPNGTIFNQVALTCDWWFNVKCESTTQLYVLNERLYKYILPVMPKFPEDFTGPEVDKYLELKFKEMEAKMMDKKKNTDEEQQEDKDKSPVNTLQSIEDSKKKR